MMKVCFLLTHIPDPRMNKRIEVLKNCADIHVICARRRSQDIWEPSQDVEHTVFKIDLPSANHIVRRYIKSNEFQNKVLHELQKYKPDVIYAEGLDTLLITRNYKKKRRVKVLYEVADLRENFIEKPKNLSGKVITDLLLAQERRGFKSVDYLIITSPKFYDYHYKSLIKKSKTLYIPNSPDWDIFKSYQRKCTGRFTVGFIGGIRYLEQMKMLVDAAGMSECDVLFAGAGGTSSDYEQIQAYCEGKEHIRFTGRYDYDTQIVGLYESVDCVYAVYNADNPNVRIALPNKLYEAIMCELPIIVAKGTYLAELVQKWGVGMSVGHKDTEELIDVLNCLRTDHDYYDSIIQACKRKKIDLQKESRNILKLKKMLRD